MPYECSRDPSEDIHSGYHTFLYKKTAGNWRCCVDHRDYLDSFLAKESFLSSVRMDDVDSILNAVFSLAAGHVAWLRLFQFHKLGTSRFYRLRFGGISARQGI